jgi:hypothetical protein
MKYCNEDLFAFQSIWGDSFSVSGRRVYYLKRRSGQNTKKMTTAGNFFIWISEMAITLVAPAFVLFWILFQDHSFIGENLDHVTSALGPAVAALIAGAFIAQVFGGIFRGCMSASIVCYLADREMFMENQGFADQEI